MEISLKKALWKEDHSLPEEAIKVFNNEGYIKIPVNQ